MTDLRATRGDTEEYKVAVLDKDKSALNLTSVSMWFTVKRTLIDTDANAIVQKTVGSGITVTDAVGGLATIRLDPADLADITEDTVCYWDLQVESGGEIATVDRGTFLVEVDVTHG